MFHRPRRRRILKLTIKNLISLCWSPRDGKTNNGGDCLLWLKESDGQGLCLGIPNVQNLSVKLWKVLPDERSEFRHPLDTARVHFFSYSPMLLVTPRREHQRMEYRGK